MRIVFRVLMIAAVFAVVAARPAMAQGDAEKGKAVYAAQKCSVCHAIAGAGSKTNPLDGVGKKLSAADIRAWIVTPKEMDNEDQVDQEAADARPLCEAAGGRHRRACRLHGQPEVGIDDRPRPTSPSRRARRRRHHDGERGGVPDAGRRRPARDVHQSVRRTGDLHRGAGAVRLRPAADSAGHLAAAPGAASRPLDAGRLAGH